MGFVSTRTVIPIDRVAHHLQVDPYHFNQIYSAQRPLLPSCPDGWCQYNWQDAGKISREELADALKQAETMVFRYLGWTPLPVWRTDEVQVTPYYKVEAFNIRNSRGESKSVFSNWGYVIEGGVKATTLIDTPATVFSDADGDGFNETVTVTVATTVTEEQELHVFYPGKSGEDTWEVRPLQSITIAAGVATIVFPKYLIPLEELIIKPLDPDDPHIFIDGDTDTNFLATVDVYRVYNDESDQVTFYYDPQTSSCSSSSTPCADDTETGCLFIKNSRLGIVGFSRADWDDDTGAFVAKSFSRAPMKAVIKYRAGHTDASQKYPELQMEPGLERMICYFALSLLDREICGCANTRTIWQKQTRDMAVSTEGESVVVPWSDLSNPLGTSNAAIRLWKFIHDIKISRSPNPY